MLTIQETRDIREPTAADHALVRSAKLPSLHDDPQKIHHLLDLLGLPSGTEVRVTTVAASVLVR